MIHCEICDDDLKDGQPAAALTSGRIQMVNGGFTPNDEPWLFVICTKCCEKIEKAAAKMRE